MTDIKLKEENQKLKLENAELRRILAVAKNWIEKEVKTSVVKIARRKLINSTRTTKDNFFNDNVENLITQKISSYFWEILILNTPSAVIDNIISAEINLFHLNLILFFI